MPRLRLVLPIAYLFVSTFLLAGCFLRLGHSVWCRYFLDSMFPTSVLGPQVARWFVEQGIVKQDSHMWLLLDGLLVVPIPFVITLGQYFVLGFIVDRLLVKWVEARRTGE